MRYVMAMLVGLAATPLMAAELTKPEWFACEQDADCGRAEAVCGDPQGVNLSRYKEYRAHLDAVRPVVECSMHRKVINLRELHSVCRQKQCSFEPAPHYREPK